MRYTDTLTIGDKQFDWIEVASLPDYSINGELYFAKALKSLYDIDQYIDVGGAVISACGQSPLNIMNCKSIVIDTHSLPPSDDQIKSIYGLVGKDHAHQLDFLLDGRNIFIKIDVDGNDLDVLHTLNSGWHGSVDPHLVAVQFEYDFHWSSKGISLQDAYEHLPYDDFYAIEHNGLTKIDMPLAEGDYNYRNVVCGEFNQTAISNKMNEMAILKANELIHSDSQSIAFVDKIMWWHNNELRKGNTAKRRKDIYPHNTFRSK